MNKKYLFFSIIPLCFIFFFCGIRLLEGPYYNGFADPSYSYLINSLSLAQMNGADIGHVDHPGTPLQVTGALVIKIYYLFSGKSNILPEDVLHRPELYLNAINFTITFLNAIGLFIMGAIIYNIKRVVSAGLLFQTIPWISINVTEVFSLVKTESFVFFLFAILISLMFKFVYKPPAKINFFILGTGILCGLILSIKIGFICLMLLPLILFPGIRNKLIFLLAAFLSFILFVIPAITNVSYFIEWVSSLVVNDQRYGRGDSSFLNVNSFFSNVMKIFFLEKMFAAVYIITLIVLIISVITKKNAGSIFKTEFDGLKLLSVIFFSMSLQIILVAKHYSHRYMFPALILVIPAMYVLITIFYAKLFAKVNVNLVMGILLTFVLINSAYNSRRMISRTIVHARESVKLSDFIKTNYPDSDIILSSGASHEFTGMMMSLSYSGKNVMQTYKSIIDKRFHGQQWYDIWTKKFVSISDTYDSQNIFKSSKPLLYQTTDETFNKDFMEFLKSSYQIDNAKLKKVFSNTNGDVLFEIDVSGGN